ncbi:MAG: single-stranded DNA-binding protein [Thermoprotei archaeon]|nr:MAG: single-stranded DNA-binding protein [Thermoprotei archaeon]
MGEDNLVKIKDLKPYARNVNVRVKIVRVGEERKVISRFDRAQHRLAEALVGDETGSIILTLWNEAIDLVREKENTTVVIKNGFVSVFRNFMRLNLGKKGRIEDSDTEIEEVNIKNNLSDRCVRRY